MRALRPLPFLSCRIVSCGFQRKDEGKVQCWVASAVTKRKWAAGHVLPWRKNTPPLLCSYQKWNQNQIQLRSMSNGQEVRGRDMWDNAWESAASGGPKSYQVEMSPVFKIYCFLFYMSGTCRGQKRALDPLELELLGGCEPAYGCWDPNPDSLKEKPVLFNCWTISPAPQTGFLLWNIRI